MIPERLGLIARAALVVFGSLMLQVGLVSDLPVLEATGDLMLLATIAAGSVAGADRGATFGFVAGLAYDLMLDTPFGLNALTYAVAGFVAGWLGAVVLQPRWWFHVGAAVVISLGAVLLSVLVVRIVGRGYPLNDVVRMLLVVPIWSGLLILPARKLLSWVFGQDEDPGFSRFALTR